MHKLSLKLAALACCAFTTSSLQALEATVGVYYYPWWNASRWEDTLRSHLTPDEQGPAAGYYNNSSAEAISQHIEQSHRGNISLWASSWWGPGSSSDNALQQTILPHPRAGELSHAVHYESVGRFDSGPETSFDNLVPDFEYLAENVFSDPNYYRIDGRPVVFMYVTRAYFSDPAAQQALLDARQALQLEYGYDPYVVGDEIFGSSFNASRASHFDAVTTFDVYGMSGLKQNGATQSDVTTAASKYAAAGAAGATVIPGVTPGYNDNAVRDGNTPTARYFDDESINEAGSVFTSIINQAAAPHADESLGNLLMVNSFNEWHEDTQIEASVVTGSTSVDDSASGDEFTEGNTYEGYGTKYLDLLRVATTDAAIPLIDGDANFNGVLDPGDLSAFAAAWRQEFLVDGVPVGGAASREALPDFNYDGVVDFFDWLVMRTAHGPAASATIANLLATPEPTTMATIAPALALFLQRRRREIGS